MRRIAIALLALAALSGPVWAQPAEDADRHMTVVRYYAGRGDHSGTINRLKLVLTQYQASPHVEEALARITEAYLALGIAREAQNAAAVLARKFPNSPWAAQALKALTAAGLAPAEDQGSWLSRNF
jgi:outer membrane protein assembly factor BamD